MSASHAATRIYCDGVRGIHLALSARAQLVTRVSRLCFLTFDPGTPKSPAKRFEAFFAGLRDLGYVHGQTIAIDYLHPEGRSDRYPELAAVYLRLKPDIIVVTTTPRSEEHTSELQSLRHLV